MCPPVGGHIDPDEQRALRVCLHSVDVPKVHFVPMHLDGALLIRVDVTADRRAHQVIL